MLALAFDPYTRVDIRLSNLFLRFKFQQLVEVQPEEPLRLSNLFLRFSPWSGTWMDATVRFLSFKPLFEIPM